MAMFVLVWSQICVFIFLSSFLDNWMDCSFVASYFEQMLMQILMGRVVQEWAK